MKRYLNNDDRLGESVIFTMPEMIAQYKRCDWHEYTDADGNICHMTDEEIVADILKHDIEVII